MFVQAGEGVEGCVSVCGYKCGRGRDEAEEEEQVKRGTNESMRRARNIEGEHAYKQSAGSSPPFLLTHEKIRGFHERNGWRLN